MSWFTRLLGLEEKASATAPLMVVDGSGQARWMPRDYASFAKEGYQRNVVAYQAINKVAESIASVRWSAWKGETELVNSPLLDLLKRPNPMQSYNDFMMNHIGFTLLSGNGYVESVRLRDQTKEMYALRSDRMTITPSDFGAPKKYTYKVGQRSHSWDVDPNTLKSDIHHTKLFNPLDDWYGMSPIEAGAYAIDQHNESMTWMQSLLQNAARPSGALVTANGSTLTPDEFNRLKTTIEENYAGARNAGRPMLLEGGMDWKQMGFAPKDMEVIETKFSSARDICLAFGVPPLLLGIKGDNTFANYAEARLAFWEDTVIPMLSTIKNGLFDMLGEEYGVELRPEINEIPAIADKRKSIWDMADKSDDLTINERREMKGFERIEGGDVILVNATQITLQEAVDPPNGTEGNATGDQDDLDDLEEIDQKMLAVIAGYDQKAD